MKRDLDLMRDLLFEAEDAKLPFVHFVFVLNPSEDEVKRYGHADLLCDVGFFEKRNKDTYRMTSSGYDYLETIRDENIWKKTKTKISLIGGSTLKIASDIALTIFTEAAKEKLGMNL